MDDLRPNDSKKINSIKNKLSSDDDPMIKELEKIESTGKKCALDKPVDLENSAIVRFHKEQMNC